MIWGIPKKVFVSAVLGVVVVGLLVGGIVYSRINSGKLPKKSSLVVSKELSEYRDTVGFMFKFPQNVKLKKNENLNSKTYSDVSLTSDKVAGSTSVKIEDSEFKTLDEWEKQNKDLIKKGSLKPIEVSGVNADEVETKDGITTAWIDASVLYFIKTVFKGNEGFWRSVHSTAETTFSRF